MEAEERLMRDTSRIKPFLEEIGKIWAEQYPDYRFGQLIEILRIRSGDLFYFEEDVFLEKFRECFNAKKEGPRHDFSLLLNIGFDESDLRWFKGHDEKLLDYLGDYYTPTALNNLKSMLDIGFSNRTTLGLWLAHYEAFTNDENVFAQDVKKMVNKFGKNNIDKYFWQYGDFPVFYYIGEPEADKKDAIEKVQKTLRDERRQNMKKLVEVGFDEYEVEELEDIYNEFFLEMIEEYYMEPRHLKKLKELLDIGFHETLLLQLYIMEPDKIFDDFSVDVVEERINEIDNIWTGYERYDMQFFDFLFGNDESEWERIVDELRE